MNLKKYYDEIYWQREVLNNSIDKLNSDKRWFKERYDLLNRFVIPYLNSSMEVLEIGCAWGYLTSYIQKNTLTKVEGCDIAKGAIKRASKLFKKINFFFHDIEQKPTKKKYDAIILFGVLEHLFDYDIAIKNIYDSLNRGGYYSFKFHV